MRFRLPEWDIPMPAPLVSYWTAWNEPDLDVTLDPASGLIARVDGFFGHPTPIAGEASGVPTALR